MRVLPLFAVVVAAYRISLSSAIAQEKRGASEDSEDTKPKVHFSPGVEKQFSHFVEQTAEAKKKIWAEDAKKEIEEIVKLSGLNADGAKELEKAAARSADLCLPEWKTEMDRTWRNNYAEQTEETIPQMIEQALGMVEEYARYNWSDHVHPSEHESWKGALKQTLTSEQFANWEKATTERKQALQKKIADFLNPQVGRTEENFRRTYQVLGAEVSRSAGLSKELSKELEGLADSISKTAVEKWRNQAERMIANADEIQRRQMFKQGSIYIGVDQRETAKLRAAWDRGVEKILPPEAKQRLDAIRGTRRVRQVQAWSQLLIAELDRRVAFTTSQRERLRPLVERLLSNTSSLNNDSVTHAEAGIPINALYTAAAAANESEFKSVLDEVQWKRWKEACKNKGNDIFSPRVIMRNIVAKDVEEKEAVRTAEPEEIETVLSDYLAGKASAERSRLLSMMLLKAEDAARVTNLPPAAVDRLQTAARGATEQSLAIWNAGLYEIVRPYANAGTVQMVTQRLANMQDYRLQRSSSTTPEQQPIWEETVKAELTADQQNAWKEEIRARDAYRDSTVAGGLLEAFERKVQLDQSQLEKLQPILTQILTEYGEEIRNMFSSSSAWYLQRYSMFLPFAAIPEKDFKELLTKEQWETWTGCSEFSNSTSYWENVKRMHEQKVKTRK